MVVSSLFVVLDSPACGAAGEGGRIARNVDKGNCLACHQVPGDLAAITSANIGPPLSDMQSRFPDRDALRQKIWDPTIANPDTVMPPFGRNGILSASEIELVIDYLYAPATEKPQ
ncbi:MAG: sulfur oxidation c-type cytochrome SoxX [Burkholderiales bacterium]